jgi:hypothetical protein
MKKYSTHTFAAVVGFCLICAPCQARVWQLWGGKASIDLPNGYIPKANGPFTYQVMAINPGVTSIVISKVVGSAGRPDWAPVASAWKRSLAASGARVVIAPRGSGNVFDVEYSQAPQSYTKKRIINGPRKNGDFRNLYDITFVAVPSSASSSVAGKALVKSLKSFKVKP